MTSSSAIGTPLSISQTPVYGMLFSSQQAARQDISDPPARTTITTTTATTLFPRPASSQQVLAAQKGRRPFVSPYTVGRESSPTRQYIQRVQDAYQSRQAQPDFAHTKGIAEASTRPRYTQHPASSPQFPTAQHHFLHQTQGTMGVEVEGQRSSGGPRQGRGAGAGQRRGSPSSSPARHMAHGRGDGSSAQAKVSLLRRSKGLDETPPRPPIPAISKTEEASEDGDEEEDASESATARRAAFLSTLYGCTHENYMDALRSAMDKVPIYTPPPPSRRRRAPAHRSEDQQLSNGRSSSRMASPYRHGRVQPRRRSLFSQTPSALRDESSCEGRGNMSPLARQASHASRDRSPGSSSQRGVSPSRASAAFHALAGPVTTRLAASSSSSSPPSAQQKQRHSRCRVHNNSGTAEAVLVPVTQNSNRPSSPFVESPSRASSSSSTLRVSSRGALSVLSTSPAPSPHACDRATHCDAHDIQKKSSPRKMKKMKKTKKEKKGPSIVRESGNQEKNRSSRASHSPASAEMCPSSAAVSSAVRRTLDLEDPHMTHAVQTVAKGDLPRAPSRQGRDASAPSCADAHPTVTATSKNEEDVDDETRYRRRLTYQIASYQQRVQRQRAALATQCDAMAQERHRFLTHIQALLRRLSPNNHNTSHHHPHQAVSDPHAASSSSSWSSPTSHSALSGWQLPPPPPPQPTATATAEGHRAFRFSVDTTATADSPASTFPGLPGCEGSSRTLPGAADTMQDVLRSATPGSCASSLSSVTVPSSVESSSSRSSSSCRTLADPSEAAASSGHTGGVHGEAVFALVLRAQDDIIAAVDLISRWRGSSTNRGGYGDGEASSSNNHDLAHPPSQPNTDAPQVHRALGDALLALPHEVEAQRQRSQTLSDVPLPWPLRTALMSLFASARTQGLDSAARQGSTDARRARPPCSSSSSPLSVAAHRSHHPSHHSGQAAALRASAPHVQGEAGTGSARKPHTAMSGQELSAHNDPALWHMVRPVAATRTSVLTLKSNSHNPFASSQFDPGSPMSPADPSWSISTGLTSSQGFSSAMLRAAALAGTASNSPASMGAVPLAYLSSSSSSHKRRHHAGSNGRDEEEENVAASPPPAAIATATATTEVRVPPTSGEKGQHGPVHGGSSSSVSSATTTATATMTENTSVVAETPPYFLTTPPPSFQPRQSQQQQQQPLPPPQRSDSHGEVELLSLSRETSGQSARTAAFPQSSLQDASEAPSSATAYASTLTRTGHPFLASAAGGGAGGGGGAEGAANFVFETTRVPIAQPTGTEAAAAAAASRGAHALSSSVPARAVVSQGQDNVDNAVPRVCARSLFLDDSVDPMKDVPAARCGKAAAAAAAAGQGPLGSGDTTALEEAVAHSPPLSQLALDHLLRSFYRHTRAQEHAWAEEKQAMLTAQDEAYQRIVAAQATTAEARDAALSRERERRHARIHRLRDRCRVLERRIAELDALAEAREAHRVPDFVRATVVDGRHRAAQKVYVNMRSREKHMVASRHDSISKTLAGDTMASHSHRTRKNTESEKTGATRAKGTPKAEASAKDEYVDDDDALHLSDSDAQVDKVTTAGTTTFDTSPVLDPSPRGTGWASHSFAASLSAGGRGGGGGSGVAGLGGGADGVGGPALSAYKHYYAPPRARPVRLRLTSTGELDEEDEEDDNDGVADLDEDEEVGDVGLVGCRRGGVGGAEPHDDQDDDEGEGEGTWGCSPVERATPHGANRTSPHRAMLTGAPVSRSPEKPPPSLAAYASSASPHPSRSRDHGGLQLSSAAALHAAERLVQLGVVLRGVHVTTKKAKTASRAQSATMQRSTRAMSIPHSPAAGATGKVACAEAVAASTATNTNTASPSAPSTRVRRRSGPSGASTPFLLRDMDFIYVPTQVPSALDSPASKAATVRRRPVRPASAPAFILQPPSRTRRAPTPPQPPSQVARADAAAGPHAPPLGSTYRQIRELHGTTLTTTPAPAPSRDRLSGTVPRLSPAQPRQGSALRRDQLRLRELQLEAQVVMHALPGDMQQRVVRRTPF